MKYKFNHEHLSRAEDQVWESKEEYGGLSVYDELAPYEYNQIIEFIPHDLGKGYPVYEMGAGLGRGSIYFNHRFHNPNIRYILCDRDGFSERNTGAFNPKEDEYYNDFELTKSFCKLNGMTNFGLFDTEKDDWSALPKTEFIFSFCSFGMHVALERYMDRLISISKENVTMIFGTRHAGYNDKSFSDKFKEVIFKPSRGDTKFPIENWLILRGLK